MISKQDILNRAGEWKLRPNVVEKDYVLGWILASLSLHSEAGSKWVFKGGTCIKKCYFETYRFSEDLDFSLLVDAAYDVASLKKLLEEVAEKAHELSGINFPIDQIAVKENVNKQGKPTFEGKMSYQGPLVSPSYPRILFDITKHEEIVTEPESRTVFHPYPDSLPEGTTVRAYAFHEVIAEKTRALYERSRPRDLFDVVYLLENRAAGLDFEKIREIFHKKCSYKSITPPNASELLGVVKGSSELISEWSNMLAHQLPALPPVDGYIERLGQVILWLDDPATQSPSTPPVSLPSGDAIVAPAGIHYWGGGQSLEAIRFAGSSHLIIEFEYHGKHRVIEPYSFRQSTTGKLLFYGWELSTNQIKAFNTAEISNIQVTERQFSPRFAIEFSTDGAITAPLIRPSRARLR